LVGTVFRPARAQPARAQILVGPNTPVSRDGAGPHVETDLAAAPQASDTLVGAAIAFTRPDGGHTCRLYRSADGGATWTGLDPFEPPLPHRAVDPQVAFGPGGAAYFMALTRDATGDGAMPFYRSGDGGRTWTKTASPPPGDHPQMAVDPGSERFDGRVYVSAMRGTRRPVVYRSGSGGRSFASARVPNPENHWMINDGPLVFADGTVFQPFRVWKDADGSGDVSTMTSMFARSTDGGASFSTPRPIFEHPVRSYSPPQAYPGSFVAANATPTFALDRRRGRLYMAWSGTRRGGAPRVFLSYSTDRGRSWSAPTAVSPEVPDEAAQYRVMLAVAPSGTVGLAWLGTRDAPEQRSYHVYFSASLDGGKRFLPARRVTTDPSVPYGGAGNLRLAPNTVRLTEDGRRRRIAFNSAYRRWPAGGDYLGMTTTAEGAFVPLWPDSRAGVFELMTSSIRVRRRDERRDMPPASATAQTITEQVKLLFGRPRYDPGARQAAFPVRLKNTGERPIYPPLRVHLDSLEHFSAPDTARVIDYTPKLGDFPSLQPGAATGVVMWELRHRGIRATPRLRLRVTGRVAAGE
jgi:hypothetical protein